MFGGAYQVAFGVVCAPFWRAVRRVRGETVVCLGLDYRLGDGERLDLGNFEGLRFLGLQPPLQLHEETTQDSMGSALD